MTKPWLPSTPSQTSGLALRTARTPARTIIGMPSRKYSAAKMIQNMLRKTARPNDQPDDIDHAIMTGGSTAAAMRVHRTDGARSMIARTARRWSSAVTGYTRRTALGSEATGPILRLPASRRA